jgi:uncharacterized membrane protein (UPF0127 family)
MTQLLIHKVQDAERVITLADHANTFVSRLRGLLGRKSLSFQQGLLISPCNQIHTIGMRFLLDVVFLDGNGVVLRCCEGMKPQRLATHFKAKHVLELPAGRISACALSVGDKLHWMEITPEKEKYYDYY